jgi:hypothetical protein
MAATARLSQSRTLAGSHAMTMVHRSQAAKPVSNGSKYFMKRDASFMVEVRGRPSDCAGSSSHTTGGGA